MSRLVPTRASWPLPSGPRTGGPTSVYDKQTFDQTLHEHVADSLRHVPSRLHAAMTDALVGGAGRLRPLLCLRVASGYTAYDLPLATASALAVEFVHCASLVHDDLPCFDDAATRRGRPSVHARHGESLAVLAGDALIVQAFHVLAQAPSTSPHVRRCMTFLAQATGPTQGIIAGQAWEAEAEVSLDCYHRAKTASLFEFASMAGALAADADPESWREFGCAVGLAYQVADDLADAAASRERLGKPTGQDLAHARPSAVHRHGVEQALADFDAALRRAEQAIPSGCDPTPTRAWLRELHGRVRAWFVDHAGAGERPLPTPLLPRGNTLQPSFG